MTYEELLELDKKLIKSRKIRNISIAVVLVTAIVLFIVIIHILTKTTIGAKGVSLFYLYALLIIVVPITNGVYKSRYKYLLGELEKAILNHIGITRWMFTSMRDVVVNLKSKQSVLNYTDIKFFKEHEGKLAEAYNIIEQKSKYSSRLRTFLKNNPYVDLSLYPLFKEKIMQNLKTSIFYSIFAEYISPAGRSYEDKTIRITKERINELMADKSLLMSKGEYSKYLKDQEKSLLEEKQSDHYGKVNAIIDFANDNKEKLIIKSDVDELDKLIYSLFEKTVNSIKKVKTSNSEEWDFIDKIIKITEEDVKKIVEKNNKIFRYYNSQSFFTIKNTVDALLNTQREFNTYIDEKVKSISNLFGTRVLRNETDIEDEYNYIHPYKKTINPFVAEVSSSVFASAENNPLEYVVKSFYPDRNRYPTQIQMLHTLIEELETLKEAKEIIENYKKEVQKYLKEVPDYVMNYDEDGFYSRLGFATINENVLTVNYKFVYTSNGGHAQRSFTVPMTEETIVELIKTLESKLTISAFSREQRSLMTSKLRQYIKERDNYTCKVCGNSTSIEPNLLLEIDHIIPVIKGGVTEESNLQTLCWKCNRRKGSKII